MGVPEPPYLYDAPAQRPISFPYSSFEPKRATKASWDEVTADSRPLTRQSRPLIDLNRHPDSYMIVTGSDLAREPMPASTKRWVVAMRWIQFALRIFTLLGAMGTLFCGICLKPVDQTQAWIMRITPGYDLLVTLYAAYHLARSARARTPTSSASYHFFALMMDAGLIPLYAFIAVFTTGSLSTRVNNHNNENSHSLWTSFFVSSDATTQIIFTALCTACALAGLHFSSLCLDLYLIIVFRKIASLPPDMNPLEDNLTSRKTSKHKYKNSELSLGSTIREKKPAVYGRSTIAGSAVDVNEKPRQVPFGHSRAHSDMSFSAHNPTSAQLSKRQYDQAMYQQLSGHNSTVSLSRQSFRTAGSRAASPIKERKGLINDNWYVLDEETLDTAAPYGPTRSPRLPDVQATADNNFLRCAHQPLAMNPPTPLPELQQQRSDRNALGDVSINRSLTVTSDANSSVYSESAPSLMSNKTGTPKSKYYGDLAAAARGVRGYSQVPQSENSPSRQETQEDQGRVVSRTGADISDENMRFIQEKNNRRRMVSGKTAEEGLGGYWY